MSHGSNPAAPTNFPLMTSTKMLNKTCQVVWEGVFSSQPWADYPAEDLIRFIAKNFYSSSRDSIKILEIGCGPAPNLWYLAREGFTVYGMDISLSAITQAKDRLDRDCSGWKGELCVGDIIKLPFQDEFFDAVIDLEAVYCNSYENSKKIYKESARILKKNGLLYARTFAQGSWGEGTGHNVGYNAWIAAEGPFFERGLSRFSTQADIEDLLSPFHIEQLEMIRRTMNNLKNEIKEWSIVARKK